MVVVAEQRDPITNQIILPGNMYTGCTSVEAHVHLQRLIRDIPAPDNHPPQHIDYDDGLYTITWKDDRMDIGMRFTLHHQVVRVTRHIRWDVDFRHLFVDPDDQGLYARGRFTLDKSAIVEDIVKKVSTHYQDRTHVRAHNALMDIVQDRYPVVTFVESREKNSPGTIEYTVAGTLVARVIFKRIVVYMPVPPPHPGPRVALAFGTPNGVVFFPNQGKLWLPKRPTFFNHNLRTVYEATWTERHRSVAWKQVETTHPLTPDTFERLLDVLQGMGLMPYGPRGLGVQHPTVTADVHYAARPRDRMHSFTFTVDTHPKYAALTLNFKVNEASTWPFESDHTWQIPGFGGWDLDNYHIVIDGRAHPVECARMLVDDPATGRLIGLRGGPRTYRILEDLQTLCLDRYRRSVAPWTVDYPLHITIGREGTVDIPRTHRNPETGEEITTVESYPEMFTIKGFDPRPEVKLHDPRPPGDSGLVFTLCVWIGRDNTNAHTEPATPDTESDAYD